MSEQLDLDTEPLQANGLWFEDGNIVLQAQNSVYKVYRGILIRESTLFESMFSLPQPDSPNPGPDAYDGCQLVEMHDDPSELEHFLNCLFDFEYLNGIDSCMTYSVVLRMATKYQATNLRKQVLKILRFVYPDDLKTWDEVRSAEDFFPDSHPFRDLSLADLASHVAIINAARETDALILLPTAMYAVFLMGADWIVNSKEAAKLSAFNKNAILAAQPALAKLSRRNSFHFLYSEDPSISPQCRSPSHCATKRRKLALRLEKSMLGYIIDPFYQLPFASGTLPAGLCVECRDALKAAHEAGRITSWEALPKAFGLPSWEKMQEVEEDEDEEDQGMEEDS